MIAQKKEHQFRWLSDKDKRQAFVQSDTALKHGLGYPPDADTCMQVRLSPGSQHGIHHRANHPAIGFVR